MSQTCANSGNLSPLEKANKLLREEARRLITVVDFYHELLFRKEERQFCMNSVGLRGLVDEQSYKQELELLECIANGLREATRLQKEREKLLDNIPSEEAGQPESAPGEPAPKSCRFIQFLPNLKSVTEQSHATGESDEQE